MARVLAKESAECEPKRKRKLMSLRNRNADFFTSSPVDFDPEEKVMSVACPYTDKETKGKKKTISVKLNSRKIRTKERKIDAGLTTIPLCRASNSREPNQSAFLEAKRTLRRGSKQIEGKPRTMVCTFMHRKDVEYVTEAIKKLGGWQVENNVSLRTTHVVCGAEKRTLNLLRGIALGCWLLHPDWVIHSLEAGHWLNEEPYELKIFPGIQECRIAQETFGAHCNIFNNGDMYYVMRKTSPPCADLKALLEICGAHIVTSLKRSNVVVGSRDFDMPPGIVKVTEQWVLDSICENMLQEKKKYLC